MTAKEARQRSEEVLFKSTDGQYTETLAKIEKAIDTGQFDVTIYKILHPAIVERLTKDGFVIKEFKGDPRGDYSTTISW